MNVDRERSAVSMAELTAFDGTDLERVRPFDEIARLIAEVTTGEWWRAAVAALPDASRRREVVVVPARADAWSSSAVERRCGAREIRLAAPQCTVATAAHELAHVLADASCGHGARFRRALADVVTVVTNPLFGEWRGGLHVDQLTEAFSTYGLSLGERRWSPPPDVERDAASPIAL